MVCFNNKTNVFCCNHLLMVESTMLSMTTKSYDHRNSFEVLRIWNQRFLRQQLSGGEQSQCSPRHQTHTIISTDLKRSASTLEPTVSAATTFLLWNVSTLSMTAKAWENRYWFEEVWFESDTYGFCSKHYLTANGVNVVPFLIVKRLNVVHDSHSLG